MDSHSYKNYTKFRAYIPATNLNDVEPNYYEVITCTLIKLGARAGQGPEEPKRPLKQNGGWR